MATTKENTPAKKGTTKKATGNSNATAKKSASKKGAAKDLQDLFEDGLKDIYWAEKALTKALPKMMKNASETELQDAIAQHLEETENQVARLEACFEALGKRAQAKKCDAMVGLIEEANSVMEETEAGPVRDAAIIASAQKVEHYEIASYGTLAAFAKVLEQEDCLELLLETLEEEKNCDELLTELADTAINNAAMNADEEEEEDEEEDEDEE